MARQALAVTGGFIGGYFGGPLGAQVGFALGSAVGGYIDPEKVQGPRLGQFPIQTGRPGVPIPIGWNLVAVRPNLLQATEVREVEVEEGSKKGGSPSIISYRYYQTFAHGLCRSIEGPIAGIRRAWENDRLVYDVSEDPRISAEESDAWWSGVRLYYGDGDQLPDPDLEADATTRLGIAQPSYRWLPYIVHVDKDITDFGAAIPQMLYEVITGADFSGTSKPYPIEDINGVLADHVPAIEIYTPPLEGMAPTIAPDDGTLEVKFHSTDYDDEGLDGAITPADGTLEVKFHSTDYDDEGLDGAITPDDGTLEVRLIQHMYEEEGLDVTISPQNGSLI